MDIDITATEYDENTAKGLLDHLYAKYLGRTVDETGLAFYLPVIREFGFLGYAFVSNSVLNSTELKELSASELKEIWLLHFGREPEGHETEKYRDLIRFYRERGRFQLEEKIGLARKISEQARQLNDKGEYDKAELLIADSEPNTVYGEWQIWHELGRAFYLQNKLEQAIPAYQKSIHLCREKDWIWSCEDLKWVYQKLADKNFDKYRDALEFFLQVVDQYPERWIAWHECGYFACKLKDYANAIHYFQESIEKNQNDPMWAWSATDLMVCYRDSGLHNEAYEYFKNLTAIQSDRWGNWHARAWTEWNLQNNNLDAIPSYQKAIDLHSEGGWVWSWNDLGHCFNHLKRYDEAYMAFQKATDREPGRWELWLELGRAAKKLNRWDDAFTHLSRSIQIDHGNVATWHSLGNYYVYKPEPEYFYAWLAYRMGLQLSPHNHEIKSELARMEIKHRSDMLRFIHEAFDRSEFVLFSYNLGILIDDLAGDTLPEKQISLINKCFNAGEEAELVKQLQIARPKKIPPIFHPQYFRLT